MERIQGTNLGPGELEVVEKTGRLYSLLAVIAIDHDKAGEDIEDGYPKGACGTKLPDAGVGEEDAEESDGAETLEGVDLMIGCLCGHRDSLLIIK